MSSDEITEDLPKAPTTNPMLEKLLEMMRDMNGKIDKMATKAELDARFDQVDARFAEVDRRFDQVDARLDGLDQRVATLEKGNPNGTP